MSNPNCFNQCVPRPGPTGTHGTRLQRRNTDATPDQGEGERRRLSPLGRVRPESLPRRGTRGTRDSLVTYGHKWSLKSGSRARKDTKAPA